MVLELYQSFVYESQALVKKDPIRRQVLRVKGCFSGSKAENLLEQGDMVLAINKVPVTCFGDIEDACQGLDQRKDIDGKLNMTIFRQVHIWHIFDILYICIIIYLVRFLPVNYVHYGSCGRGCIKLVLG